MQNTGTCYPGLGWICQVHLGARPIGLSPGSWQTSLGLGSMSRYSAQILICIFQHGYFLALFCSHCLAISNYAVEGCALNMYADDVMIYTSAMSTHSGLYIWGFTTEVDLNHIQRIQSLPARTTYNNLDYINFRGLRNLQLQTICDKRHYVLCIVMLYPWPCSWLVV